MSDCSTRHLAGHLHILSYKLTSRLILLHTAAYQPAQTGLTHYHTPTTGNYIHELPCPRVREGKALKAKPGDSFGQGLSLLSVHSSA